MPRYRVIVEYGVAYEVDAGSEAEAKQIVQEDTEGMTKTYIHEEYVAVEEVKQRMYTVVGHEVWTYKVKATSLEEAITAVADEPYKYRYELSTVMHIGVADDELIEEDIENADF